MSNLRGFYKKESAYKRNASPVIERPDLVAQMNGKALDVEPYRASLALERFILQAAGAHVAVPDAPNTWKALKAWDLAHEASPEPMPVFNGGCENTIYSKPEVNHAFRAWHDSVHLAENYDFSRGDEIRVGLCMMQQARRDTLLTQADIDAIVYDVIGQTEYYWHNGRKRFISNQALFVGACFKFGIKEAVTYEW